MVLSTLIKEDSLYNEGGECRDSWLLKILREMDTWV